MTTKKKAIELVKSYLHFTESIDKWDGETVVCDEKAKQMALICVRNMIKVAPLECEMVHDSIEETKEFLVQVELEIENL